MPKIYRVIQGTDGKPAVGSGPTELGVRVPTDIEPDLLGYVSSGIGGMSVSPSLVALPPHRIPRRLHPLVPKATGKDFHFVWSMGVGVFAAGAIAVGLLLRLDLNNDKHGFVEPEAVMPLSSYQQAIEATQERWQVDESG